MKLLICGNVFRLFTVYFWILPLLFYLLCCILTLSFDSLSFYFLPSPTIPPSSFSKVIRLYILFSPLSPPFIHFIPSTLFPYQVFQSSPPPLALSPTSFPPRTCILTRYKPSVLFPRGDAPGDYITCKNVYVYVDARYHCCPFFLTSRK